MPLPVLTVAPSIPVLGYIPTSPPSPVALAVAAALAVASVARTAAAAADLAQALSDLERAKANREAILQRPVGTGEKRESIPSSTTGGQTAGRLYTVSVSLIQSGYPEGSPYAPAVFRYGGQRGAIGGLTFNDGLWSLVTGDGELGILRENAQIRKGTIPQIIKITPDDGIAEIPPPPTLGDPLPSGYNGTRPKTRKPVDQGTRAALGLGSTPKKPPVENGARAALGLGSTPAREPNTGLAPSPPSRKKAPDPTPPLPPPETKPKKPIFPDKDPNEKDKTPPFIPPSPTTPDDISKRLIGLGAIISLIASNTSPEALKSAAKTGSCESLQSPSCTKGIEDRIKNPIMGNVDAAKAQSVANAGAISAIANLLATVWAFLQDKIGKVLSFLDNTIVDRAIGAANLAMNVHNALMLSNNLGKTLVGVVDAALNTTPLGFVNTEGRRTNLVSVYTGNVGAFLINLVGQDRWTELTNDWKVANRIYQSSTNLLNKTERLLAGQSKVSQKSGVEVANIGNALRANGLVNPNSYPPMAATKEANTPTELMSDVNSPLSSFGSTIKNLNAVTRDVSSTLRQVSGIQKEFGKLQDLTNKESKVRKSLRSQSAAQAKARAKFTSIQIKLIKATGVK